MPCKKSSVCNYLDWRHKRVINLVVELLCMYVILYCDCWKVTTVSCRHREDDHTGEICRAASSSEVPVCGLQQVCGRCGTQLLPQQCGLQDHPLLGLQRRWQEVSMQLTTALLSVTVHLLWNILYMWSCALLIWTKTKIKKSVQYCGKGALQICKCRP